MSESLVTEFTDQFARAYPDGPRMGLRERKKAAAMRRIQQIAVEQFEEHGYDAVTIEHIAEHAEVSPSSVYRYFRTKEGLLLHDEYDDAVLVVAQRLFAEHDPWTGLVEAIRLVDLAQLMDDDLAARRTRLWHEIPAVRAAGFTLLDQTGKQLAVVMHQHDRYGLDVEDYEVIASSLMGAVFLAIERWHASDGTRDLGKELAHAIELLRPSWASPHK